jgi:hypothetical protein
MSLSSTTFVIQRQLFPMLEDEIGILSDKCQRFVAVVELSDVERFMGPFRWVLVGRKPEDRLPIAKAFIAKTIWNFTSNRALLDYLKNCPCLRRLIGWETLTEIPSESTFSRAFADFAKFHLPEQIHEAMVKENLGDVVVGHISRDATAIPAREKPIANPEPVPATPKKRGRPCKGQVVEPVPLKRLQLQLKRSLTENLLDLPTVCNCGTKKNAQGFKDSWIGYKLHLDVIDADIPVSAILTSASLHDSQVAIPLAQMSHQRIPMVCYDLMDAAFDAEEIRTYSKQLGHIPIIDTNPRQGEKIPMEPATARRFKQRSSVERVNSQLKDNFGALFIRVRGVTKVMCHIMFGILACAAIQILQRASG